MFNFMECDKRNLIKFINNTVKININRLEQEGTLDTQDILLYYTKRELDRRQVSYQEVKITDTISKLYLKENNNEKYKI